MKPPTDACGSELHEGDFVGVKMGVTAFLTGFVTKLLPGGLVVEGGNKKMPGRMIITVEIPVIFDPDIGARISEIFRLVDPRSQKLVDDLLDPNKSS